MTAANGPYLEVTYRQGRPLAAYLYLPRQANDRSARTRRVAPGLIIDLTSGGRAIGIEITAPSKVSVAAVNRALRSIGASPLTRADLAPMRRSA
jgi:hypothetical protein